MHTHRPGISDRSVEKGAWKGDGAWPYQHAHWISAAPSLGVWRVNTANTEAKNTPPPVHPMATQEDGDFVLCCVVLCCVVLCCVVLCCVVLCCIVLCCVVDISNGDMQR